jgi:hypothetical protein
MQNKEREISEKQEAKLSTAQPDAACRIFRKFFLTLFSHPGEEWIVLPEGCRPGQGDRGERHHRENDRSHYRSAFSIVAAAVSCLLKARS